MSQWIDDELFDLNLGDRRLDERAKALLERFMANPQASINAACHGWSETLAAYRFFDNDKVREDKILEPHRQATIRRMAQYPVTLVVQDTTELDFTGIEIQGDGPLSYEHRTGFLDHSLVAFTPEGLCLGVLDAQIWARSDEPQLPWKQRKHDPIETKESFRWVQMYRQACAISEEALPTKVVMVADSEADIYEMFVEAEKSPKFCRAEYVIRLCENRALPEPDQQAGAEAFHKLFDAIADAPVLARRKLKLSRTPKRRARTAKVEIRAKSITLKPPFRRGQHLAHVTLNVILIREINPPPDEEPIAWLLATSLPIITLAEVERVIDYYICRWQIEVYYRVLKTGCKVEDIQLETADRLKPCLMLYKIVAWRVLYATMLGRECPTLACDVIFVEHEWKSVWTITTDTLPPETAPPLQEFLILLAKLGGYNNRQQDGPPGPQAIWSGMRRMHDFALAWTKFGPGVRTYV
jgi:Transposase DNA-binding/Transposase Tn5 dimerisation domain